MLPESLDSGSPLVSILIVNYNGLRFMDACVASVQEKVSVPFEIVMVDNASTDGSLEHVQKNYPWVKTVPNSLNLGFAGGNNLAARHASGKYLLLLNNDTVMLTDLLAPIRILEQDERVGIVGARMYDGNMALQASTGHFPAPWRLWKFTLQWSHPEWHPYGDAALCAFQTDWVQGSCLLTTAQNWHAIGGLDESAFMYGEDVEFCAYTRRRGLLTVQCSAFEYQHFGGYDVSRMALLYAGYRRFHARFSSWPTRIAADVVLLLGLLLRIIVYGVLALLSRRESLKSKLQKFIDVAIHWRSTAPKPAVFARGGRP